VRFVLFLFVGPWVESALVRSRAPDGGASAVRPAVKPGFAVA
jgi:hypothetical protein